MLYAVLLSMSKWLVYCTCYCLATSRVRLEDPYEGEYRQLAEEILETCLNVFKSVVVKNDGDNTNYEYFI